MKTIIYDCEVSAFDWLVIFKDSDSNQYTVIHNDNDAVKAALDCESLYFGFNSKGYDQFIIKGICANFPVEYVKQINDWIIGGNRGWDCPLLKGIYFDFNNVDIMDDMQKGLSLKAIEGHLGLDIRESTVPFDLDRPWTSEELEEMIFYCKHDVDATEEIVKLRKDYLKNKIHIGKLAGLDEVKALSMTNAKLTATLLKANRRTEWTDEREYVFPDNLNTNYIQQDVLDFFNQMYDKSISDEDLFSSKFDFDILDCKCRVGFGGIHGAIPNYFKSEGNGRIIRNFDVSSYYPHLMTINGYTSRNIPSPKVFEEVLETRMKAKAAGDKATANALKLVVNTTYGAMLNQYNALLDPLMGRSVCVSGQLYLLELVNHLVIAIPGLTPVQINTDGIMIEFDESEYPIVLQITKEWQDRTGFELEEDRVQKIAQKDVNNYLEVQESGEVKLKGGYLVRGISTVGSFNINNNFNIVAAALRDYFLKGTLPEETIENCKDIHQFQIIAKGGSKYKESYWIVNGKKQSVQKVNRVYATSDSRYGKIYKVKAEDDSEAKIASLPEHCLIDNDNSLTIDDIDKSFYINLTWKRINDFKGVSNSKVNRLWNRIFKVFEKG